MVEYAKCQALASHNDATALHLIYSTDEPSKAQADSRMMKVACALLQCNFYYPDLILWVDGEFSTNSWNWSALDALIESSKCFPPIPDYPLVDWYWALHALKRDVLIEGHFNCYLKDILVRAKYDNHAPFSKVLENVEWKFLKEEQSLYHIFLPQFFIHFLFGFHIKSCNWVTKKGQGYICVDSSIKLHPHHIGAPNLQIAKPGLQGS